MLVVAMGAVGALIVLALIAFGLRALLRGPCSSVRVKQHSSTRQAPGARQGPEEVEMGGRPAAPPPPKATKAKKSKATPGLPPQARLAALANELGDHLSDPRLQPPAWQLFLETVYSELPPKGLSAEQTAKEAANLAEVAAMSSGVLRALRRALLLYHPDKNRAEEHGGEWAAVAEEVTKMATSLLLHYRDRVAASSADLNRGAEESGTRTAWQSGPPTDV